MNKYNEEKLSGERYLYSVPYLLSEDRCTEIDTIFKMISPVNLVLS